MVDLMVGEQQSGAADKGVPAGFKMTEVGVIPQNWDVKPLKELCQLKSGLGITSKYIDEFGNYPCYGGNGIRGFTNSFTHRGEYALIGRQGALCGNIQYVEGDFFASEHALVATMQSGVNARWLSIYLEKMNLNQYSESSAQPGLSAEKLNVLNIITPPEQEQQIISNTISEISNFIYELKTLIVKKQSIKTATMQQLLTGKTRLPQFVLRKDGSIKGYKKSELGMIPEDWIITNIGQFTDCCAGGTPSTKVSAYWGGTHPWMSSGELHLKQVYTVADNITDEGLANSSTKYVPKNSVLVGLAGQGKTRGTVAINRIELCTNQSIAAIFPSEHHSTEFLFYNLDNRYEELRSLSTGDGGRGGLNLTIIRKLHLAFPPKEEQTAIAAILSDMDKDIQTLQQRLDKTRQLKQGMMQELLTGKTRLIERN